VFHHVKWQNQFQHGQKPAGEGQGQKRFFQGWLGFVPALASAEEVEPKFSAQLAKKNGKTSCSWVTAYLPQ